MLAASNGGNALGSMAKVKERIMLSGGVMTSIAMTDETYKQLQMYKPPSKTDAFTAPQIGADARSITTMHAIFCYGWWDNPRNVEDGYWICKNRCDCLT
jgi:hypothetical protein